MELFEALLPRLSSTPVPRYPDYYEVSGGPLMINGFYAQTNTFSSAAPIYRKPGVTTPQRSTALV